jgi:hypothetical protein
MARTVGLCLVLVLVARPVVAEPSLAESGGEERDASLTSTRLRGSSRTQGGSLSLHQPTISFAACTSFKYKWTIVKGSIVSLAVSLAARTVGYDFHIS